MIVVIALAGFGGAIWRRWLCIKNLVFYRLDPLRPREAAHIFNPACPLIIRERPNFVLSLVITSSALSNKKCIEYNIRIGRILVLPIFSGSTKFPTLYCALYSSPVSRPWFLAANLPTNQKHRPSLNESQVSSSDSLAACRRQTRPVSIGMEATRLRIPNQGTKINRSKASWGHSRVSQVILSLSKYFHPVRIKV